MSQTSPASWIVRSPNRDNARVRLVCFPHGGGGPQAYRSWADGLPDWIDVVSISPPGRGPRLREAAVTEMAVAVETILAALTPLLDRPIILFGHSAGALLAFETAQAIVRAGYGAPLRVMVSGFCAPEIAARARTLHDASDDDLMSAIGELGLLPVESLQNVELRGLLLPPMRADFALCEKHRLDDNARVTCPLTAMGGRADQLVDEGDLAEWAKRTEGTFALAMFEGGHFYTQTAREEVLALIAETAAADLAALPPSVAIGATEDYPLDTCLHELFRRQVVLCPERTALLGVDGTLTFGELDRDSDLLARALVASGVAVDAMTAIFLETSADFVVAYLAALKAGGAYLPIPLATPDKMVAEILESVRPRAVITGRGLLARLPDAWRAPGVCAVMEAGWQDRLKSVWLPPLDSMGQTPGPQSLAYCVMTSGTTGKPKGIVCPHIGAVNSYWWRFVHLPYGADEREACNVFFVWEVLRPLLQGRPAYVIPDDVIFDPRRLIAFLDEHAITRVLFTPSLFEQVLAALPEAAGALPALRMVILNGEVVSVALRDKARTKLAHVALVNDYSISECHDVTTSDISEVRLAVTTRYVPAGRVMANVRVYVLDEALVPVPWGAAGEIYVAGPNLARGYLDLPEMTAERFLPDPIQGGSARMFRTGDVGRLLADGQLEVTGRSGFMIKLRGYSVVLSAVEAAIAGHSGVAGAAVVTVDDAATGQPDHLVGYVAGLDGAPDEAVLASVRSHLREVLPGYAIPSVLVPMAALPIAAATGKIDRRALPKVAVATTEPVVAPVMAGGRVMARMRGVWREVLGCAPKAGGDNFFDLGGHSLLAIELALKAETAFGVRLDVIDVFDYPTLEAFSRHVEAGMAPVERVDYRERVRTPGEAVDVAVIGMACRFPGADSPEALWRNLVDGVCSIRRFSDAQLAAFGVPAALIAHPDYVKAGAVLDDVAAFDPTFFGLSVREATLMDPQQRLFIQCCWEAMERAGHAPGGRASRVGVFAGCYLPSYLVHHLGAARHLDPADPTSFHLAELGNDKDYLASRTAYLLDLDGPAISVQTSCSTGLVAIAQAAQAIQAGQCDMALAGASSLTFPQGGYLHVPGHIAAREGVCRTFDAGADGTILGDGVGVVVLRRLDDALADGDTVLAVIKGFAVNNDGARKAGYSAPSVRGQADVVRAALDAAGVNAATIGYVEAHGTATPIGDPIEVRALTQAFARHTSTRGFCALGSIKPNIGHANIAAGTAGFIKAVLALQHRQIPQQIHYATPNAELRLDETPFTISTELRAFVAREGEPRRAGVSSFGIGGTNAHVILEEGPEQEWRAIALVQETGSALARLAERLPPNPLLSCDLDEHVADVLPLSARSGSALEAMRSRLAGHLEVGRIPIGEVAAALQLGRQGMALRAAVVARDAGSAASALRADRVERSQGDGGIVFVFPGQGVQHAAMGAALARSSPTFAREFAAIAAMFAPLIGRDLHDLFVAELADGLLARADGLQPALFAVELALARTLMSWGIRPSAVAGHSLGQYVAAVVAGVLSPENAVRLVAARARATQDAGDGAMMQVAASEREIAPMLAEHPRVSIAAVNSVRDVVVAGPLDAIAAFETAAAARGLAGRRLAVNRAFHSPMMAGVAEAVRGVGLETIQKLAATERPPPLIPPRVDAEHRSAMTGEGTPGGEGGNGSCRVACNVTGGWLEARDADGAYWARHVLEPVRFGDNAAAVIALQPSLVIEVGPGSTLTGLLAKCDGAGASRFVCAMRHPADRGRSDWDALCSAVARAFEAGVDINWRAFREGRCMRKAVLPTYPFAKTRCWPEADVAQTGETSAERRGTDRKLAWGERFHVPSLKRTGAAVAGGAGQTWLVLADAAQAALGCALTDELIRCGHHASLVADREGIAAAFARAADAGDVRVVCAWPLGAGSDTLGALIRLAQALIEERRRVSLFVLVPQSLDGAMVLGPLLSLTQEAPAIVARVVETDGLGLTAIVAECTGERLEPWVGLRGRARWVERFDRLSLGDGERAAGEVRLARGPHIIIGGMGRIGQALAAYLAGLGADVVVVSRSVRRLEDDYCGRITAVCADVSKPGEIAQVMSDCLARHGRIGGVFHAAGLARVCEIRDVTAEGLAAELAPKVAGTEHLADAIAALPDDGRPGFVMLFSSLASNLGGLGLGPYAAANRFMDAFVARQPVRDGVPWVSAGWDDWDFDYGEAQMGAYAQTRAGFAISPEEGFAAIAAILGEGGLHHVLVSATALEPRIERWTMRHKTRDTGATGAVESAAIESSDSGMSTHEQRVRAVYLRVLGGAPGLDDDFFALGGDSLMATQIVLALTGADLRIADVFDYPSIRRLAAHLRATSKDHLQVTA